MNSIEEILKDLKLGKMVILVDDEDRENEGDLLVASEFITPEHINFMSKFGRGLICLTLNEKKCKSLNLPLMVQGQLKKQDHNLLLYDLPCKAPPQDEQ